MACGTSSVAAQSSCLIFPALTVPVPGTTVEVSPLLVDPVVQRVAEEVGRTPAQVLLKWALQQSISEFRRLGRNGATFLSNAM